MRRKTIPKFRSEAVERAFWGKHDAAAYLDLARAVPARFPELKSSARTISLRLPVSLLDAIKVMAHRRDVPYQSLMKMLLAEAVERTGKSPGTRGGRRGAGGVRFHRRTSAGTG